MVRKILVSNPIDNYEALRIIKEKFGVQTIESSPIVARTNEFLNQISIGCSPDVASEIRLKLESLGVPKDVAIMLLNVLPLDEAEVRALLPPENQTISLEIVKKIVEELSKCRD